jgi:hypothetical protein
MVRIETQVVCPTDIHELAEPKGSAGPSLKTLQEALTTIASEAVVSDSPEAATESEDVDEDEVSDKSGGWGWRRSHARGHTSMEVTDENDELAYEFEDVDEDADFIDDTPVLFDAVIAVGVLEAAAGSHRPSPQPRERRARPRNESDDECGDEGEEGRQEGREKGREDGEACVPEQDVAGDADRGAAGVLTSALEDAAARLNRLRGHALPEDTLSSPRCDLPRRRRRVLSLRHRR